MITLDENLLIERGSERSCYRHPKSPNRCIKIIDKHSRRTKARDKREIKYIKRYKRAPKPLTIIPNYFGEIRTNLGSGHQFELILDYDGNISTKLSDYVRENGTSDYMHEKIITTYHTFLESNAVVSDLHPGNLLVQKKTKHDYQLIMVDGFGNSDFVMICDFSRFFTKKKLIRKFRRMLVNLKLPISDIQ
jgi:hypothetical protein